MGLDMKLQEGTFISQESYDCFNCEYLGMCDEMVNFDCPYEDNCWDDED